MNPITFVLRFDIHYYTCGGCNVLLNVDTRAHDDVAGPLRTDDISATPLEKLIHTKYVLKHFTNIEYEKSFCE